MIQLTIEETEAFSQVIRTVDTLPGWWVLVRWSPEMSANPISIRGPFSTDKIAIDSLRLFTHASAKDTIAQVSIVGNNSLREEPDAGRDPDAGGDE